MSQQYMNPLPHGVALPELSRQGRPSIYTAHLAEEICVRLSCGESLRRICADEQMPDKSTVIRWLAKHAGFRARYAHARSVQADVWADEIKDLVSSEPPRNPVTGRIDLEAARRLRNRIGTLRWLAEKLLPKGSGVTASPPEAAHPLGR